MSASKETTVQVEVPTELAIFGPTHAKQVVEASLGAYLPWLQSVQEVLVIVSANFPR
jgi:hypothetical protein